jgi:2-amino-4-hydroxy-6-hydroxymethyldihydropteridine diphosphokinase
MRAGIALGSNVGDRLAHLREAWREVKTLPGVRAPFSWSRVYETEPVGPGAGEAPFLNAVGEVEFDGHPVALLDALQGIEAKMGRPSKRPRNAPRAIDLDVLYAGNLVLANEDIVIPHPRIHLRRFVLEPLSELRPELVLPGQERTIAELFAVLSDHAAAEIFPGDLEA